MQHANAAPVSGWRRFVPAGGSLGAVVATGFGFLAVAAGVAVMLWLILAVTILPTPSIDGDRYLVKWGTWPQGQVPVGATVVTDDEPINSGLSSRLGYVLDGSSLSIVKITGDIRAAVQANPGLTDDHYLALCIAGDCLPGDILLPVDHVMGELSGRYQPPFTIKQVTETPQDSSSSGGVE